MDVNQYIFATRQQLGKETVGVGGGAGLMAQWAIGMGLQNAALDPASTGWRWWLTWHGIEATCQIAMSSGFTWSCQLAKWVRITVAIGGGTV